MRAPSLPALFDLPHDLTFLDSPGLICDGFLELYTVDIHYLRGPDARACGVKFYPFSSSPYLLTSPSPPLLPHTHMRVRE